MVDFLDALNQKPADQEKPVYPPQGTYIWAINKPPTVTRTKSGEWDIIEFPLIGVSAEDDVDADELEAAGGASKIYSRYSFIAPTDEDKDNDRKKTLATLNRFIERVLRVDDFENMSTKEALDASVNHQFLAQLVWEPRKDDPEQIDINIKGAAPLD